MTKTIRYYDMNIKATEEWNEIYEEKKEKIKMRPVKSSHVAICGSLGSLFGISLIGIPKFDAIMLAGIGGAAVGAMMPYVLKKIKIADLDYQIFINKSIINDLKKGKAKVKKAQK